MAFTPFSAKNAMIRISAAGVAPTANDYVLTGTSWNVRPVSNKNDTTNFEGGGYGDAIGSILEADISISDINQDALVNPYDSPVSATAMNLVPGNVVSLHLYLWKTGGPFWEFLNALVVETPETAQVRANMKYAVTLYGKGLFSFPTGTVNTAQ